MKVCILGIGLLAIGMCCGDLALAGAVAVAGNQSSLELRLETQCGTADAALTLQSQRPPGPVCLQGTIIIDRGDVATVELINTRFIENGILLTTTDSGAQKLEAVTRVNVGRRIGIVVSGRLVSVPVLREPLAKELVVAGGFSREEAEAVMAALK